MKRTRYTADYAKGYIFENGAIALLVGPRVWSLFEQTSREPDGLSRFYGLPAGYENTADAKSLGELVEYLETTNS